MKFTTGEELAEYMAATVGGEWRGTTIGTNVMAGSDTIRRKHTLHSPGITHYMFSTGAKGVECQRIDVRNSGSFKFTKSGWHSHPHLAYYKVFINA